VALYESLKNFLIVPILLFVRTKSFSGQGLLIAHFVFWYGFLRLFTDYFREYGDEFLGIGTGQYFNLFMAVFGIGLFIWSTRRGREQSVIDSFTGKPVRLSPVGERSSGKSLLANRVLLNLKKIIFVMLLIFSLTIPSSWTQGVLKQYRERQKTQQESLTKELVLTRPAIAESLPDSES
jgi:phosphatidylglycerol:prolipoprotein diacylglycerol transferase